MDILKQQEERDEEKRWDVLNKIKKNKKNANKAKKKNDVNDRGKNRRPARSTLLT